MSLLRRLLGLKPSAPDPLGKRGESRAADYVRRNLKLKILATNLKAPGGELDIIALDANDLVFIEVRTRATADFGAPEKTIRAAKRRFLIRAANWYIKTRKLQQFTPRFDTIAIIWPENKEPEIRYLRNAFTMRRSSSVGPRRPLLSRRKRR